MKIIIDAMGGDNAPLSTVKGTWIAKKKHPDCEMVLVGRESEIRSTAAENGLSLEGIAVVNAEETVSMEDDPSDVFRNKAESSLCKGLRILKEDGDAFLSAGSTGALIFCATMTVRRLPGVDRPCLAAVLPFDTPLLLLDAGANIEVKAEYIAQWALLGSIYYKHLFKKEEPRVGLVNNGAEATKGTPLQVESYKLLSSLENINFIGNVEARYIPSGKCDVLVCDGFTGNVILKYTEGISKTFMKYLKEALYKSPKNKVAGALMKKDLTDFKEKFNYKNYGGAPVVGVTKPVFKAHGNSDGESFAAAIEQTVRFIKGGAASEMKSASEYLKKMKEERKMINAGE